MCVCVCLSLSLYRYTVYNGVTPGHVSVSANLMEVAFKQKLVGEQIGWLVQHTVALWTLLFFNQQWLKF